MPRKGPSSAKAGKAGGGRKKRRDVAGAAPVHASVGGGGGGDDAEVSYLAREPVACLSTAMDVAFRPVPLGDGAGGERQVLVAGLVTGEMQIFTSRTRAEAAVATDDEPAFRFTATVRNLYPGESHVSCRTLAFDHMGNVVFTGGSNGSLHGLDASTGALAWTARDAHDGVGLNRVSTCLSGTMGTWALLSGDENGAVKLWDARQDSRNGAAAKAPTAHTDYVADFCALPEGATVATCGGDGTLAVLDVRKLKVRARSEELETELLSLSLLKDGTTLVAGTQDGALFSWNVGGWEAPVGKFPGHPDSIECILKVTENVVLTGAADGMIRILSVEPNKVLGVLGFHDDFPVERMAWSSDRAVVATCSHDNLVRVWDTAFLFEGEGIDAVALQMAEAEAEDADVDVEVDGGDDDDDGEEEEDEEMGEAGEDGEDDDDDEEEEEEGGEEDEDEDRMEEEAPRAPPRRAMRPPPRFQNDADDAAPASGGGGASGSKRSGNPAFFDDL